MSAYRMMPGRCCGCGQHVADLAQHYAFNPPRGCAVVALAFDKKYWPFLDERKARNGRKRGRGKALRVRP